LVNPMLNSLPLVDGATTCTAYRARRDGEGRRRRPRGLVRQGRRQAGIAGGISAGAWGRGFGIQPHAVKALPGNATASSLAASSADANPALFHATNAFLWSFREKSCDLRRATGYEIYEIGDAIELVADRAGVEVGGRCATSLPRTV